MTSSFKKINYSLRPAKHAARRMLCEIFGRVHPFQPVDQYVYVGFGSVWFQDFVLFHRHLGVREMVSIERDTSARDRIEANKPFRAISVQYKAASRVLPKLNWARRHILWLDYEDALSREILLDLRTTAMRSSSGTLLALTLPCQRAQEVEDAAEDIEGPGALSRFHDVFGRERVGPTVSELDLEGWPFGVVTRSVLRSEIEAALAVRNNGIAVNDAIQFTPICDINYDDGTKMTTVVGIFATRRDAKLVKACDFNTLDFLPKKGRLIQVKVPKLTNREVRTIERQLPRVTKEKMDLGPIPVKEARAFADLYRYLPNFAALET